MYRCCVELVIDSIILMRANYHEKNASSINNYCLLLLYMTFISNFIAFYQHNRIEKNERITTYNMVLSRTGRIRHMLDCTIPGGNVLQCDK